MMRLKHICSKLGPSSCLVKDGRTPTNRSCCPCPLNRTTASTSQTHTESKSSQTETSLSRTRTDRTKASACSSGNAGRTTVPRSSSDQERSCARVCRTDCVLLRRTEAFTSTTPTTSKVCTRRFRTERSSGRTSDLQRERACPSCQRGTTRSRARRTSTSLTATDQAAFTSTRGKEGTLGNSLAARVPTTGSSARATQSRGTGGRASLS
mmetsp:Transcript_3160/g.8151  ORF Transcript_3160/g.8151 Transcript_3160/m.8151 type:complete len:209 (+) Transcript_3160:242-868(+)